MVYLGDNEMYKKIPGNDEYKISLCGKFLDVNNEECTPLVQNSLFRVSIYGKEYHLDISWLSLICHFETELPKGFENRILDIYFQDMQKELTRSISGKVMRFKTPITIDKKYRIVPGFTRYAVSKNGEILDLRTWRITKIYKSVKIGYPSITIYNPDKSIHHNVYIHRLVALAWVNNSCFVTNPVVNHKDGDKNNFHASNLEWVSFSYNSIHAIQNGLRPNTLRCKVRNAFSGEVKEFQSGRSACEYMGIEPSTKIGFIIYKKKHKLVNDKFEVKLLDDNSPWFYEKHQIGVPSGRYTVFLTYENGLVEEHPDVRTFRKKFKIWNVKNIKEVVSKFESIYPGIKIDVLDNFKLGDVQAFEVKTGKVIEAGGIRQLSEKIDIPFDRIHNVLKRGELKVVRGYVFRYKVDQPWDTNFIYHKSSAWCITATQRKSGETKKFKSLREASKFFNRDRAFIRKCLNNEWSYGDWKIKAENLESSHFQ